MANNVAMRTTYHSSSSGENTAIRSVAKDIKYLYPNRAVLWTLMNTLKGKMEKIDATTLEWLEKDTRLRWGTIGATTVTPGDTVIAVTDGSMFVAGDLVNFPRTAASHESARVTSVSGNNITVVRGVSGTTAGTYSPGAHIALVGSMHEEGGAAGTPVSTNATTLVTYPQIFKNPVEISNTAKLVKIYGTGNRFKQDEIDAMTAHKEGINRYLYFGPGASQSLTGGPSGKPIRATQSLASRISTNVYNLSSGLLTFRNLQDWAASVFEYGVSQERFLISDPILMKALTQWGHDRVQLSPTSKVLGMDVQTLKFGFGQFKVICDYQLKNGWAGNAFIIDPDNVSMKCFEGRNCNVKRDTKKDGADRQFDEIISEVAFCIEREETHAHIYGMTDYQ